MKRWIKKRTTSNKRSNTRRTLFRNCITISRTTTTMINCYLHLKGLILAYDNCTDCTWCKKRIDGSILHRLLRHSLQTYGEATGLKIQRYLSGSQGGDQQIGARISCDEIDVLLFFRDPINRKASEPNEMNLLRLCDVHNVPVATNIATAEALIMALERGDLDWRKIGHPTV